MTGKDWTGEFPFPARRCLALEFIDSLASDTELRLDIDQVADRHLEWQIVDRTTQEVKFACPFWPAYPERTGSSENGVEYSFFSDYSNPIALVLGQLSPAAASAHDDQGVPLVLRWQRARQQLFYPQPFKSIPVVLEEISPDHEFVWRSGFSWAEQIDKSYASQTGQFVGEEYALLPSRDLVVVVPAGSDSAQHFVVGARIYSASLTRQNIYILNFREDGSPRWNLTIELDKDPIFTLCTEKDASGCSVTLLEASVLESSVKIYICVTSSRGDSLRRIVAVTVANALLSYD